MMTKGLSRILVVDDDRDILELLKYNLEKQNFKVKTLSDSRKAIEVARDFEPDLIILDVMMPNLNGIDICRSLRSISRFENTYIFFLTAKADPFYQQAALKTGGDDYIEKITGLRALTCKINAVLKKHFVIRKRISELRAGNMIISGNPRSVSISNHKIILSDHEFQLLFFLAQNPDKMITLETLIQNIWGSAVYLGESSVETCLYSLQKKIGNGFIQRVQPGNYRFMSQ